MTTNDTRERTLELPQPVIAAALKESFDAGYNCAYGACVNGLREVAAKVGDEEMRVLIATLADMLERSKP